MFRALVLLRQSATRAAILAAALGFVASSEVARAEEFEDAPAVLITFDPASAAQRPIVAAAKAHLNGLDVRVLVKPIPHSRSVGQQVVTAGELARSSGALGTFSIELGSDRAFLIFFTEQDGNTTLVRRLPPGPQTRVMIEGAAIVVRSMVEALLEGRRIGMASEADAARTTAKKAGRMKRADRADRARAPTPTSEARRQEASEQERPEDETADPQQALAEEAAIDPVRELAPGDASPGTPASHLLSVSAGYAGSKFASKLDWQSGFTVGACWYAHPPLYAGVRYTFFPTLEGGTDAAGVSVSRHPSELLVGYLSPTRLAANAELGLIADYTSRRTDSTGPEYEPTPETNRWMLGLGARVGAAWSVTSALQLALRAGADFLFAPYGYVIPSGETILSPHQVRPRLDLEVALGLW